MRFPLTTMWLSASMPPSSPSSSESSSRISPCALSSPSPSLSESKSTCFGEIYKHQQVIMLLARILYKIKIITSFKNYLLPSFIKKLSKKQTILTFTPSCSRSFSTYFFEALVSKSVIFLEMLTSV